MWVPLNERLASLPLILAGPIVRRVEPQSVTIWVALKEARTVTLRIFEATAGQPSEQRERMRATAVTVPLGEKLHVLAITGITAADEALDWGQIYLYNLYFSTSSSAITDLPTSAENLTTANILVANPATATNVDKLVYADFSLPGFILPPSDLNQLRMIHASCRKPHGEQQDAFEALDIMLAANAADPMQRPHQIYLTGDQIYADDVADPLLHMVSEAGEILLGWREAVPDVTDNAMIRPGHRAEVILHKAGLTPAVDSRNPFLTASFGIPVVGPLLEFLLGPTKISAQHAKSHLIRLGEYYAMYLFAWSPILWQPATAQNGEQRAELPELEMLYPNAKKTRVVPGSSRPVEIRTQQYDSYLIESSRLNDFFRRLPNVRRALANTATYMIFDDHEVTDDWYLNLAWCERVLPKELGRFIIRNGLLAYAVFQAWGNTPLRFAPNQPGRSLLDAAVAWAQSKGTDAAQLPIIDQIVDLPKLEEVKANKGLLRSAHSLHWHYQVAGDTYQVLVLDTRTWRAFPGASINFAALLSDEGCQAQIVHAPSPTNSPPEITIVVSPAPVLGVPFIEEKQHETKTQAERFASDTEAWSLQTAGLERLFGALAERISRQTPAGSTPHQGRIVLLSGDVHFGYATRFQYWSQAPFKAAMPQPTNLVVSQLTASSLKNETGGLVGTRQLHTKGYIPLSFLEIFRNSLPDPMLRLGWTNLNGGKLQVGTRDVSWILGIGSKTIPWTVSGTPAIEDLAKVRDDSDALTPAADVPPEWRYRIDYLLAEQEEDALREVKPRPIPDPSVGDRKQALAAYLTMAEDHEDYVKKWGDGKEIVGVNNIGEVRFHWGADDDKAVTQLIWWRLESTSKVTGLLQPFPLTKWNVSLRLNDAKYPRPEVP